MTLCSSSISHRRYSESNAHVKKCAHVNAHSVIRVQETVETFLIFDFSVAKIYTRISGCKINKRVLKHVTTLISYVDFVRNIMK